MTSGAETGSLDVAHPVARGPATPAAPARVLPPPVLRPLLAVGAPAGLGLLVFGVLVRGASTGTAVDRWLAGLLELSRRSSPTAHVASYLVGTLSDPVPAAVCVAALVGACLLAGRRRLAVVVVLALTVTDAVGIALKHLVGRTIHGANLSYPSTHAAQSTAYAMLTALLLTSVLGLRGRRVALAVLAAGAAAALVEGWALVAGSVHYATDTLAGAFLALALVPVVAGTADVLADRRRGTRRAADRGAPGSARP